MSYLNTYAYYDLYNVTIQIGEPTGYPGTVWNNQEYAMVKAIATNNTGCLLRDVAFELRVSGNLAISPIHIMNFYFGTGKLYLKEFKPGEVVGIYLRLKATGEGNGFIDANVSAEVVPYASRDRASRTVTITAA